MTRTLATADIGSNTAHLLVAETDGHNAVKIDNTSEWIGLGEIIAREGVLADEIVSRIIEILRSFVATGQSLGAESLYVFATEAIRVASNGAEACARMASETGLEIHVIPAGREAELSLRGVELDTPTLRARFLLEIGGGSLQVGELSGGTLIQTHSLRLGTGTVVATTALRSPCPKPVLEQARHYIEASLESVPIESSDCAAVASGGVARGIWRALHPDGEPVFAPEEMDYLVWASSHLSRDQLSDRFRVKPKRAGTLLPGALVFQTLMRRLGVKEMRVSQYGIREGAILEMAAGKVAGTKL